MAEQTQPVKILELTAADWFKGISFQRYAPIGGIWQIATNFDPFEMLGYLMPSLAKTQRGSGTIVTVPFVSTEINDAGTSYIYIHTATKLYQLATASGTVTDITTSSGITTGSIKGAIFWKGFYIYALNGSVIANTVGTNTNTTILTGLGTTNHKFEIGPDNNLYVTDGVGVHQITSAVGTTGNTLNVISMETGMTVRDLVNEGRYMVLIADGAGGGTTGKYRCVAAFWDLAKGSFDILWDTWETGFIGAKKIDDDIIIIGYDHIYQCSRYSNIRKTGVSFRGNSNIVGERPTNCFAITKIGSAIYWGASSTSKIYAYGTQLPGGSRILYCPHEISGGVPTSLCFNGTSLFVFADTPTCYQFQSGSTRSAAVMYTSIIPLNQSYKMAYIKVVYKDAWSGAASGVDLAVTDSDGSGTISTADSRNFTGEGAIRNSTFLRNPTWTVEEFESFFLAMTIYGVGVQKIEFWAVPVPYTGQKSRL